MGDLVLLWMSIRNFMSFGNDTIRIAFTAGRLTVVLGENADAGGEDARNGTGKSSLLDALFYVFFGKTLRGVKGSKLIHKFAKKNQSTTVEVAFIKGNTEYLIERGENPSRLLILEKDKNDPTDIREREGATWKFDKSRSKNETKASIEKILGYDFKLSEYLWGNSSESVPFLLLDEAKKREVIENLFGFAVLTERADKLKELRKVVTKDLIDRRAELTANEAANARIHDQITALETKNDQFEQDYSDFLKSRMTQLGHAEQALPDIDLIEANYEIECKRIVDTYEGTPFWKLADERKVSQFDPGAMQDLVAVVEEKVAEYRFQRGRLERTLIGQRKMAEAGRADYAKQLAAYKKNKSNLEQFIREGQRVITEREEDLLACDEKLTQLQKHDGDRGQCLACGQDLPHDPNWLKTKIADVEKDIADGIGFLEDQMKVTDQYIADLDALEPPVEITAQIDTKEIENQIENLSKKIAEEEPAVQDAEAVVEEALALHELGKAMDEAKASEAEIRQRIEKINAEMAQRALVQNPYPEQIKSLRENTILDLKDLRAEVLRLDVHEENYSYLIDMLVKRESFVRKRIVEKWLASVNHKLFEYVNELELPHSIRFDDEMDVMITNRTKEMDYRNLSRGERSRVNNAVNFAFQDTFETMNFRTNVLWIDELLDNGLDQRGATAVLNMIRRRNRKKKHVFLITHRVDISDQIQDTLLVRKENDISEVIWS